MRIPRTLQMPTAIAMSIRTIRTGRYEPLSFPDIPNFITPMSEHSGERTNPIINWISDATAAPIEIRKLSCEKYASATVQSERIKHTIDIALAIAAAPVNVLIMLTASSIEEIESIFAARADDAIVTIEPISASNANKQTRALAALVIMGFLSISIIYLQKIMLILSQ